MMFNPQFSIIRATKVGAASRQVDVAIDAFEAGDYAVAITLAGAAEGMLPEIETQPLFTLLRDHRDAPARGKEWIALLNAELYWLKHLSEGEIGPIVEIDTNDAAVMLLRALAKIPDPWSEKMEAFKDWAIANGFGPKAEKSPYLNRDPD